MSTWGIIVAAGRGERLGAGTPKAFVTVAGRPMLDWSIDAFVAAGVDGLVVAIPPDADRSAFDGSILVVAGGASRRESVRAGLAATGDAERILVHDAARPCVSPALIVRALDGLDGADAVVPAIPVTDTLKRRNGTTVSRDGLWRAQTPQAFRAAVLRDVHERAAAEGASVTDDVQLVERYGGSLRLVEGDERNIKITTAADLAVAEALLSERHGRSGIGYDAHAFVDGRPLVIGCVTIPHARGLAGHSDADVLAHAIVDALLGAAALGDIGEHFPSSDPRWAGAPSAGFLREAASLVAAAGWTIESVDATVVLESPAIAPFRRDMRARIAAALDVDVGIVSVKASTTDGIGSVDGADGAAATAVARLVPR